MSNVTICVLTYGDHPRLVARVLDSIRTHCPRSEFQLAVGANAVGEATRADLDARRRAGEIDRLIVSETNLNKCPMMRRIFQTVHTELIWWFDDDSYINEPGALSRWLKPALAAADSNVMWGQLCRCNTREEFTDLEEPIGFVRSAPWYRGLPPPSWRPGGKGEFNFENRGCGDGRWDFIVGGCWLIRTSAVRALDWPDPRLIKLGDDVFLGEAIRQQGWELGNIGTPGVAVNTEPRRGDRGSCAPRESRAQALA
ncbi:MAG TPA: glycosyltransferase [Verrucomicrobiae bacterium]|nr:glycosyltransferase [Verrucomicrobiae bacterium]